MTATTVKSAAATNTQIDNDALNPTRTGRRSIVHLTLVFDDVAFNPDALYDALDAAYPTVKGEKDVSTRGTYIINIST